MSNKTEVNTIAATDVIKQADKLFNEREHFETKILARTNDALYKLLADVYALYKNADEGEKCMKESVASMRSELKKRGIVTQANTPRITVFVRYVFNSDRKRSYNYTQTLLAAIEEKIDPNDLPEFINSKSGVEEIKRTRKTNADSIKQKAAVKSLIPVVKSELESMPAITSVKLNNPPASSSSDTCLPPL